MSRGYISSDIGSADDVDMRKVESTATMLEEPNLNSNPFRFFHTLGLLEEPTSTNFFWIIYLVHLDSKFKSY